MKKNYWEEINELRKRNMEIDQQIRVLMSEQDQLYVHYRCEVYRNPEIRKRYYDLEDNLDRLTSEKHNNKIWIDELRAAYRRQHSEGLYYKEMDNIDILNEITKNGFIIAVKFQLGESLGTNCTGTLCFVLSRKE